MAALINWLLAEGQTSHLEELTEPAPLLTPACVTANDNKGTPRPVSKQHRSSASENSSLVTGTAMTSFDLALACCYRA